MGFKAFAIAVAVFCAYATFPLLSPELFNSPDDSANAFFIGRFAEHGELWYSEPMNLPLGGRVVSRSMVAIGERVVPIGFPGLALAYGIPAIVFGARLAEYFTPLLVAISAAALFLVLRKRFDESFAWTGVLLYAGNPVLWYYASRGLYPNAVVVALVVLALSLSHLSSLASLLLALAVLIRPPEVLWVLPLAVVMMKGRRVQALVGIALGLAFALILNRWVYGAWFVTGYSDALAAPNALETLVPTVRAALGRLMRFGYFLLPLHALLGTVAAVWLAREKQYRAPLALLLLAALVVSLPYAYFGARDLISLEASTIGTSLTRYWMPVFLALAALIALALKELQTKRITMMVLAVYLAASFHAVWFGFADSLAPVLGSLRRYDVVKREVLKRTESDALIIVEQGDKVLFPERRVIAWLRNPGTIELIPRMRELAPTYYFGLNLKPDEAERLGLAVVERFDHETLYRAVK